MRKRTSMTMTDQGREAAGSTPLGRLVVGRRELAVLTTGVGFALASPARAANWHNIDVTGSVPRLTFTMTDAATGHTVTAKDFRGKLVMLYLGYTHCPDVCPLTLHNIAAILHRLGKDAENVRVLFVTVDPHRDTLPLLKQYTALFAPASELIGLRPDANQLATLARRYRLAYSVTPATATQPYTVTHSSAVYVFDRAGNARLLVPSLASTEPDLAGTASDLERLLYSGSGGLLARLSRLF